MDTRLAALVERAEQALRMLDRGERESVDEVANLALQLQEQMRAQPATRPRLGPLLGRLRAAARRPATADHDAPAWIDVGGGKLAVGHRPKRSALSRLQQRGTTHVLTLLAESEGALDIRAAAEAAGIAWLWLPLANGEPPAADRTPEIASMFATVRDVLAGGGRVFVHCSAGIHRTGLIAHGLLRYLGHSRAAAAAMLAELRSITADGVGAHRLAWGDAFGDASGD